VVASALGVAIAIVAGFELATLVAAGCYLAALLHAGFGRWPRTSPARDRDRSGSEARAGAAA
jgi:hypothetical protein